MDQAQAGSMFPGHVCLSLSLPARLCRAELRDGHTAACACCCRAAASGEMTSPDLTNIGLRRVRPPRQTVSWPGAAAEVTRACQVAGGWQIGSITKL